MHFADLQDSSRFRIGNIYSVRVKKRTVVLEYVEISLRVDNPHSESLMNVLQQLIGWDFVLVGVRLVLVGDTSEDMDDDNIDDRVLVNCLLNG